MERHRFWILLGLALTFGLVLQIMKKSNPATARIAGFGAMNGILEDGQAIYHPGDISEYKSPVDLNTEKQPERASPSSLPPPPSLPVVTAPTAAKTALKKDTKKKDDKKKVDTKKKKKKKKKKMDPKNGSPFGPNQQQPGSTDEKKPEGSSAGILPAVGGANTGNAAAAIDPVTGEPLPQTAKEWEDYLLAAANMDRTEKFIRAYQTGSVPTTVFYEVVNAMLTSTNQDIQKLGVMGLGATPSLKSFELLSMVSHTAAFPSVAKTQAAVYLRVYARLENLKVLTADLARLDSSGAVAANDAIQLMLKSAQTYLQTAATATTTSSTRTLTSTVAARYFNPALAALLTASTKFPDKTVQKAAANVYSQISALMPVATINPTIPVATSPPTTTPGTGSPTAGSSNSPF